MRACTLPAQLTEGSLGFLLTSHHHGTAAYPDFRGHRVGDYGIGTVLILHVPHASTCLDVCPYYVLRRIRVPLLLNRCHLTTVQLIFHVMGHAALAQLDHA